MKIAIYLIRLVCIIIIALCILAGLFLPKEWYSTAGWVSFIAMVVLIFFWPQKGQQEEEEDELDPGEFVNLYDNEVWEEITSQKTNPLLKETGLPGECDDMT